MKHHDTEKIIKIIAVQAVYYPNGPNAFFRNLVLKLLLTATKESY